MSTGDLTDDVTPLREADEPFSQSPRTSRKPIAGGSPSTARSLSTAKTSLAETTETAMNPHERLIQEDTIPNLAQEKYVRWGVAWKTPLLIVLWTLSGFACAIGHHLYYQSLDGTRAGASDRQHWAVRFGTALAFLVVACLRAACDTVYKQYIWTVFKRKTLSLDALDKLFSATADPTALVSWDLLRHAKIAFLVAITCWCMPMAGITPPATLSVVLGYNNKTMPLSFASLDWQSPGFMDQPDGPYYDSEPHTPSSDVLQIATTAAQLMAPVSPPPPAANTSFQIQFFGPTVQCSLANDSQQIVFDNFTRALAKETNMIATRSLFESGKLKWGKEGIPADIAPLMNVYSAFSPWVGIYDPDDEYNDWSPGFDFLQLFNEYFPMKGLEGEETFMMQHLLIQTADQAIVCTLGNATFDVGYEFVGTASPLVQYSISNFDPIWVPRSQSSFFFDSYVAVYMAFSNMVHGNVSTTLTNPQDNTGPAYEFNGNVTIYDSSSRVLQHGLSACDDFKLGYWNGNGAIGIGQDGPVPWQQAATETEQDTASVILGDEKFGNISNNLFTKPSWMCRNRTLLKAVEDLANNITISLLSSDKLVKPNATTVPVLFFSTENLYRYDSRNLILSYGIAAFITVICACIGFFALHYNGVAHSTAFSALVATTRNHELDAVSRGHSLGALPLQHTKMDVRFGELAEDNEGKLAEGDEEGFEGRSGTHIGFGAADKVVRMRKGGKYV